MNLVIGSSSQLAHYFPNDYIKISSRNIDFDYLKNNKWDSVYITFAEQRIYDENIDYMTPNYLYTLEIINSLINNSNKIVCYTSCELWAESRGHISITSRPVFNKNNKYALSKLFLLEDVIRLRKINSIYNKIIFIHPFYFNSTYRSEYFLFGKIFDSIINKKQIEVGDLNFSRDMVHTSFVVQKSIAASKDSMVGSGYLFNVRRYIQDLYEINNLNYYHYVKENISDEKNQDKLIRSKVPWIYTYQNLLDDTQRDIESKREKNGFDRGALR